MAGAAATKPATGVEAATPIVVVEHEADRWVSRGAHKLIGALDAFALAVRGRAALDAGASTGGFTQVLLDRGAASVIAADVGYGQLAWVLQSDERVRVMDRTNVRALELPAPVDVVVADLSFISLGVVLPALARALADGGDLLPMVKPQFEVGREALPSGGVVRDPEQRAAAVRRVAQQALAVGLGTRAVVASPLPGPSGNVEYFLHLRRDAGPLDEELLATAIADGPR